MPREITAAISPPLESPTRVGVEQAGATQVDVDRNLLAGPTDIVRLQLGHRRLAGEAEGRVGARARRLEQLDRRLYARRAVARLVGPGAAGVLRPEAEDDGSAV